MKCTCCQTNEPNESRLFCANCWDWLNNKMSFGDVIVVLANIEHRTPKNKQEEYDVEYAKEICQYLVADNYMQGKAKLGK